MTFIRFMPCPKCNSRDNLAEYTDNYYCFGCGFHETKRSLARFKPIEPLKLSNLYDGITLTKKLPSNAKKWLLGYGLTSNEIAQFNYDEKREHLHLINTKEYYQARNFSGYGAKYVSKGIKPHLEYGNSDIGVLVEDVISAIKVGRQYCAIPMLGSIPLKDTLSHLKHFKSVHLWGDYDKASQNVVNARKLSERLGLKICVIISIKDPKEYNDLQIMEFIGK